VFWRSGGVDSLQLGNVPVFYGFVKDLRMSLRAALALGKLK
jgi:hypothetical protein